MQNISIIPSPILESQQVFSRENLSGWSRKPDFENLFRTAPRVRQGLHLLLVVLAEKIDIFRISELLVS